MWKNDITSGGGEGGKGGGLVMVNSFRTRRLKYTPLHKDEEPGRVEN